MEDIFEIVIKIFAEFFKVFFDALIEILFDKESTKKERIACIIYLCLTFGGIIALTAWGTIALISKGNKIGAALVGSLGGLLLLMLIIRAIYDIVQIKKNQ